MWLFKWILFALKIGGKWYFVNGSKLQTKLPGQPNSSWFYCKFSEKFAWPAPQVHRTAAKALLASYSKLLFQLKFVEWKQYTGRGILFPVIEKWSEKTKKKIDMEILSDKRTLLVWYWTDYWDTSRILKVDTWMYLVFEFGMLQISNCDNFSSVHFITSASPSLQRIHNRSTIQHWMRVNWQDKKELSWITVICS